jgi:uroporphyrinogen-III synthase
MRVLVLRPQADAERTARRLEAHGHEAVIAPVLRIERTDEQPPPDPFSGIILTSANAVPALAAIAAQVDGLPVFAIGERTGSEAAEAGFKDVRMAEGDAASLAALIGASLPPRARLLYVAGRERKPEPEASLTAAGFSISTWVAYEAIPAERLAPFAQSALRQGSLDVVLHYSRRSAAVALDLAARAEVMAPFLALTHVCLSADTAVPLYEAGAGQVRVAEGPDEDALLAALDGCREISGTGSRRP